MFVTTPDLERQLPVGLGAPGSRYWDAVMLSTESPWFLVTLLTREEAITQTIAVAWETTLINVIESIGKDTVVGLGRIATAPLLGRRWVLEDLDELWLPSPLEASQSGPLLFRVRGESLLRDCFFETVAAERTGRNLFVKLPIDSNATSGETDDDDAT